MTTKKILVTGGAGYIGSHTAVELINNGYDVVIIDNLSNSRVEVLDGIKKITGQNPDFSKIDLCNYESLEKFFKKYKNISGVIHFAAHKAVGESVSDPLKYYKNNLVSLMNLLELMSEFKIYNFVFSSSCTVYGEPDRLPITESAPIKPANCPYGNTKQISEEIIRDFASSNFFFKSIALRYFNPIGAHDSAVIGELPLGEPKNLVPYIMQTAIGKREELRVFGNDYGTPDGTCIRDYIHVIDVARAHIAALKRLEENKEKNNFEVFNIGTGRGTSVMEAVRSFEKISGRKLKYKIAGRRPGDIEKIYADTSLANRELNWCAEKTLDDAMLSAWKWEQNLLNNN